MTVTTAHVTAYFRPCLHQTPDPSRVGQAPPPALARRRFPLASTLPRVAALSRTRERAIELLHTASLGSTA